jgi:peptidyl-prolyl cis-trans isomerase C
MSKSPSLQPQSPKSSGNAVVIVLGVLVVVAVGALTYMNMNKPADSASSKTEAVAQDQSVPKDDSQANAASEPKQLEITPGNPVVARVGTQDITRQDVVAFAQNLPDQLRQMPVEQLFPMLQDQVINAKIISEKTKGVSVESDPEFQRQLALAKDQITRSVFIQNEVQKRINDDGIKQAYDKYKAEFPKTEEVRAAHILVADEQKAKDLIAQLKSGSDFATLAKENSKDGTAQKGGDLGYFAKSDVVPEFADAAFALTKGAVTETPVKTQFGWHVIRLDDRRQREPGSLDSVKPMLEAQLRREILDGLLKDWRASVTVERFDINGKAIEPAAGTQAPVSQSPASQAQQPSAVSPATAQPQ